MGLRLLVGLGNPGTRYRGTRHNLGFDWIERLAEADGLEWRAFKDLGEIATGDGPTLARPLTFMNESGRMVAELCRKSGLRPDEVLVGLDDMSLPVGRLRLRAGGSAGGHNGLRSVMECLGTQAVPRLRLGIGGPPAAVDPVDFVLSRFKPDEKPQVERMLDRAVEAARAALSGGLDDAMTRYNRDDPS